MQTNFIQTAFNHFIMISYQTLHDKFDFDGDKITKFYNSMHGVLNDYALGRLNTQEMLIYSVKIKVDCHGWVKSLPIRWKYALVGFKANQGKGMKAIMHIEAALLVSDLIAISVLKEEFGLVKEELDKFNEWQRYYIDSYVRGYLNDEMINELMIEECHIDMFDYMDKASRGEVNDGQNESNIS